MKLAELKYRREGIWDTGVGGVGIDTSDVDEFVGGGGVVMVHCAEMSEFRHFFVPATWQKETLAERFDRLASRWKEQTQFASSVVEMSMHRDYQEIISLGEQALPLILRRLRNELDHWFWALRVIAAVDPVPRESRGDLPKMRHFWLQWGERNRWI